MQFPAGRHLPGPGPSRVRTPGDPPAIRFLNGLAGPRTLAAMSMTFGLLGTGYWATETHAAGLVAAPDARFAGVWGRDPVKAKALADRYGVRAYPDVDGLLADVDAVAIALPPQV